MSQINRSGISDHVVRDQLSIFQKNFSRPYETIHGSSNIKSMHMPIPETISYEEYLELSENLSFFKLQESFTSALYNHFMHQHRDHSIPLTLPWNTAVSSLTCIPVGVLGTFMPHEKMIPVTILSPKLYLHKPHSVGEDLLVCTTIEQLQHFMVKVRLHHAGSSIDLRISAEDCMRGLFQDPQLGDIQKDIQYHQGISELQTYGLVTIILSHTPRTSEN